MEKTAAKQRNQISRSYTRRQVFLVITPREDMHGAPCFHVAAQEGHCKQLGSEALVTSVKIKIDL